jgi:Arc/MetJ family transcription regulator
MTEAIAAFGVAANIVQFLEVASRLASKAREYSDSAWNGGGEVQDLQKVTEDLQTVSKRLEILPVDTSDDEEANQELPELARRCQVTTSSLLNVLQTVQITDPPRKRDAVKMAFRRLYKEEEIRTLQTRLDGFRQELSLQVLVSLR